MRHSLFPSDDSLPTWLHTVLLVLITSFFAVPLIWCGVSAIATAHLDPVRGPEFGEYFFGPAPLNGKSAVVAGFSLFTFGCAFSAMALRYSRLAPENIIVRALPWCLIAVSGALSFAVK